MTHRKNYNSIVFLTTLSVYLGLVLIGAPPVLAQAALTQKIEVKNEAEIKDDLDKKPDDEKAFAVYASTLKGLLLLAAEFSSKNADGLTDNKIDFDCFFGSSAAGWGTTCNGNLFTQAVIGSIEKSLKKIHTVFPHASDDIKAQVKVNFLLSRDEFSAKTTLYQASNELAEQNQAFYDAALSRIKIQRVNDPQIITYQNTSITFENTQVFIVTRLPRASIDELLAKKDAQ